MDGGRWTVNDGRWMEDGRRWKEDDGLHIVRDYPFKVNGADIDDCL